MRNISPDALQTWIANPEIQCLKDVMLHLGMNPYQARSYRIINNWAKINGVDLSPLKRQGYGDKKRPTIWKNDEVFSNPSAFPRGRLCEKLLEIGIPYGCSKCGTSDWLGKRLRLHVDHINSNSVDNRLENLRFLCPNCHTQITKWKKPKHQCETCHQRTSNPRYCNHQCVPPRPNPELYCASTRPSKEVLVQLAKNSSWTAVAREYGVTDTTVRKWARSYGLEPKQLVTEWKKQNRLS